MSPRGRAGLSVVALLAAALGLSACFGPPPPPPPPPPSGPCQGALSVDQNPTPPPPASPVPVSPGAAEDLAVSAVAASTTRNAEGQIPLVTVAQTPNGPEITSTLVASADEAADVAAARAADGALVAVDVDSPVSVAASNDTLRSQQWALDNVAFEQAWVDDAVNGSGVKVAVVDTGVLQSHPDLAGQVLQGREFLGSTHQNVPGGTTDGYGHGTHVAGIIGALAGNGAGITGAAPGVQILPVKVLCPNGQGSSADVAAGVVWAVNAEAKVVNLSLGGGFSTIVKNALIHAQINGVTVVAAAGNCGQGGSGCDVVNEASYPGAFSQAVDGIEAIAVAATTNANAHALYSTSGSYVDISAPGGAAGTNSPATAVLSTWNDGQFKAISGTSMATPYVAAAAALLVQKGCTVTQVRARLLATADPLGSPNEFGAGLVDPLEAAASCS